jgi:RNA polymerase sigma-70 factor (ECF subfamily)
MSRTATAQPRMTDQPSAVDPRRLYEDALVAAMRCAERYLPRDQALEVAHDVASEMLRLPPGRVTGTLIYVAVTSRLRSLWRRKERRAALEGAYHERWSSVTPLWAEPGAEMEIRELQQRIDAALADMPPGMRKVFVLVREEGLSYKEAAARLGVNVGTVHTQLSRANALLRQVVARYRGDAPGADPSRRTP